jgi:hypothetical protein
MQNPKPNQDKGKSDDMAFENLQTLLYTLMLKIALG